MSIALIREWPIAAHDVRHAGRSSSPSAFPVRSKAPFTVSIEYRISLTLGIAQAESERVSRVQ